MSLETARILPAGTARSVNRNTIVIGSNITNSTTTGSVFATILANPASAYQLNIQARLYVRSAATTTGVQLAVLGPTTNVTAAARIATASAAGTELVTHVAALNEYQAAVASLTTPTVASIDALVASDSTSSVQLAFRSEVSGSLVTILAGSVIEWTRTS